MDISLPGLDTGQWEECQNQLDAMLIEGAQACVDAGELPSEVIHRLTCSGKDLDGDVSVIEVCMIIT